jgi:hypothetical protein
MRDTTLVAWRGQGLPAEADLNKIFQYDLREEIDPDLEHGTDLVKLARTKSGLARLRKRLDASDPHRLPKRWSSRVSNWKERQHVLMLFLHDGFFLTLGIGGWRSFADLIYLVADEPEFVRQVMAIQGNFAARLAERILREVTVDAVVFGEPIADPHGSLISPRMYEDLVLPSYQPALQVLRRFGVETVILRTYANARALLPSIFKAGFNCLWANERDCEAMDYLALPSEFGRQLRLIGGIDLDVLRQDKDAIRGELERVLPPLLADGGYIPLADGRVREDIPFENYVYYRRLLEEMVGG